MKVSPIKRFIALSMVILVLISTTGFTMNIHFCGGELQGIAINSGEVDCNMMAEARKAAPCPMHAVQSTDCCEDQDVTLEPDSPETFLAKFQMAEIEWQAAPTQTWVIPVVIRSDAFLISWTTYRPPPIDRDIPVLVQSFLL